MAETFSIAFCADYAPIRAFAPLLETAPEAFYHDLLPELRRCDYKIVNLEAPLSAAPLIVKSGAAFAGNAKGVKGLSRVPFDAALLANNHAFDCGETGFYDTVKVLETNRIAYAGAGVDLAAARKPLVIEKNDLRIGVFTLSEGEDEKGATENRAGVRPWEIDALADEIKARKKEFDFIFVSAHCGLEYQPYPSFYVWESFRELAEAGADLIIGHHPHVPQGMTYFGKTPAFFSLGNFAFYQPTDLWHRKTGYFLKIEIGEKKRLSVTPIPYRIADDGLHLLKAVELESFHRLLDELSAPLGNAESARGAWHAVLAYSNADGFKAELTRILAEFEKSPAKGAAMLRNRVLCMQHYTQWRDGLTRVIDGTINDAPAEYVEMVRRYFTRKVEK